MVEYIETNNKRFPVRFGFNALREFSRVTGMPLAMLSSLQNDITLDQAMTKQSPWFGVVSKTAHAKTKCRSKWPLTTSLIYLTTTQRFWKRRSTFSVGNSTPKKKKNNGPKHRRQRRI
jgi:hypothetical protein